VALEARYVFFVFAVPVHKGEEMRFNVGFECPICKIKTPVRIKKPGYRAPIGINYTCEGCQSIIFVQAERPRGSNLPYRTRVMRLSKLAFDMIEEEKAHNEKPMETV
jgi:hypothetical protein